MSFKPFLSLFIKLYLFLFGLSWVLLHVYIRFILDRPSYDLYVLRDNLTYKLYMIFLFFIVLHLFLLIHAIILLIKRYINYTINQSSNFYRFISFFNNILDILYWKPLEFLHDKIGPYIPASGRFFLYLESIWKTKGFTYLIIFFFDIFPRILLCFTFLIEVIIYKRVHIFIHLLVLIFIPILFKIFLKLFNSFAIRGVEVIKDYFEYLIPKEEMYDTAGVFIGYKSYDCKLKDEYVSVINPKEQVLLYEQLLSIQSIYDFSKKTCDYIYPYITLLCSSIYVIAGIFRFLFIF